MNSPAFPIWVMPAWMAYAALGMYFYFSRNIVLKQRLLLPYMIGGAAFFLFITSIMRMPTPVYFVAVPVVTLITWINYRRMRFCASCGATILRQNPFKDARFCSKCGAEIPER